MLIVKIFLIIFSIVLFSYYFLLSANPVSNTKSKAQLMRLLNSDKVLPFIVVNKVTFQKYKKDLHYPVIFKPDFCGSFSKDVKLIKSEQEAETYLEKNDNDTLYIIQKFHKGPYEGTIMYLKNPFTENVEIIVVERVNPNVNNEKNWLWKSSDSGLYGYYTIHRPQYETEELKNKIIEISSNLPDFHYGRYDVRWSNTNDFIKGIDINIIELNLKNASDTRFNEKQTLSNNIYYGLSTIYYQILFGLINFSMGNGMSFIDFLKELTTNNKLFNNCYDLQIFTKQYKKLMRSYK